MSEHNKRDPDTPEGQDNDKPRAEEQATEQPKAQVKWQPDTEELVVGQLEEETGRRGRPLRYDLIGGGVLLLIVLGGLYFFIGYDGGGERLEPAQQAETGPPPGAPGATPEQDQPRRALTLQPPAAVEEWSPADFQLPPPQEVADVEQALQQAETLMASGNLIEPQGNNALAAYLSVLEEDPGNAEAEAGIDQIATQLVQRANQAVAEGRMSDALELVSAVETIRPETEGLAQLQGRVEGQRELINLLAAAARDLTNNNLTAPEGDNALAKYRQVLASDPDNADARQGIANVELRLLELATAAARELNFQRAQELLASAEGVREGPGAVDDTRQNIEQFREETFAQLGADARGAIAAEDYTGAGELIAQAAQVLPEDERIAQLQQELTRARVYAQYQPGDTFQDPFTDGSGQGPAMVVMPVGSFLMGSPDGEEGHRPYEGPVHEVTFIEGFAVAQTEVTVGQFRQFVEDTGYVTNAEREGETSIYSEDTGRMEQGAGIYWIHDLRGDEADEDLPVIHVSWNDARAYAEWLAGKTGQPYRLLSEAEFEYAVRGDTQTPYWWGTGAPEREVENLTGEDDLSEARRSWTNYFEAYGDDYWGPAPVAEFITNPFGLYDMGGNVSEWVADCWHDSYARAPSDGSAWINPGCDRRVVRGAAWGSPPDRARSAYRISGSPDTHTTQVGFRVARDL